MVQANSFNIPELYQKIFGLSGARVIIPDSRSNIINTIASAGTFAAGMVVNDNIQGLINTNQGFDPFQASTLPSQNSKATSILGTPIYEQIQLTVPGTTSAGNAKNEAKTYMFPGWPLFTITGQRNIVKTQLQGKDGSVKEYISDDDYSISIKGFLINDDSWDYPVQQFQELMQIIEVKTSLQISSQVFSHMKIHNIVIDKWSFPSTEGYPNMQAFELECTSDIPIELEIKSVKNKKR